MHELGHVTLRHGHNAQRCFWYQPNRLANGAAEREANQFMQAAILPKPILLLALSLVCAVCSIDVGESLCLANTARGRWLWRHRIFLPLINLLCVSRHMIAIKIRSMKVFSANTANYHLSYGLQTRWHVPSQDRPLSKVLDELVHRLRPKEAFRRARPWG